MKIGIGTPLQSSSASLSSAVAEITEVTVSGDSNASLHDKNFRIFRATNEHVAFVFDAGAAPQQSGINLTGRDGSTFVTEGPGYYVKIPAQFGDYGFWFNSGTEYQPAISGVSSYAEIAFSNTDPEGNIASALATAINNANGYGSLSASADGSVVTITDGANGPRSSISSNGSIPAAVIADGRNAAAAIGGVTSIIVPFTVNDSAPTIASALVTAANGNGWTVSGAEPVTFVDAATGARTDAYDTDTGFTITVTQQGSS